MMYHADYRHDHWTLNDGPRTADGLPAGAGAAQSQSAAYRTIKGYPKQILCVRGDALEEFLCARPSALFPCRVCVLLGTVPLGTVLLVAS